MIVEMVQMKDTVLLNQDHADLVISNVELVNVSTKAENAINALTVKMEAMKAIVHHHHEHHDLL